MYVLSTIMDEKLKQKSFKQFRKLLLMPIIITCFLFIIMGLIIFVNPWEFNDIFISIFLGIVITSITSIWLFVMSKTPEIFSESHKSHNLIKSSHEERVENYLQILLTASIFILVFLAGIAMMLIILLFQIN